MGSTLMDYPVRSRLNSVQVLLMSSLHSTFTANPFAWNSAIPNYYMSQHKLTKRGKTVFVCIIILCTWAV